MSITNWFKNLIKKEELTSLRKQRKGRRDRVYKLYFIENFSKSEIGRILGVSEATIRSDVRYLKSNYDKLPKQKTDEPFSGRMDHIEKVEKMYFKEGLNQEKIAHVLDTSTRTIERDVQFIKENSKQIDSIERKNMVFTFKELSKKQIKEIHRLADMGIKYKKIAKLVGTTAGVVGYTINRKKQHTKYIAKK